MSGKENFEEDPHVREAEEIMANAWGKLLDPVSRLWEVENEQRKMNAEEGFRKWNKLPQK